MYRQVLAVLPFLAAATAAPAKRNGANPLPYMPEGGADTTPDSPPPNYVAFSDFDWQSLNLGLNQEYLELDLFHAGLAKFNASDFDAAGINAEDRSLIEFMADQEVGHAKLITDMLGEYASKPCNFSYPFQTVPEFIDFCQKVTRYGEAGVYGFLSHLDSRPAATLLTQSITVEARQQLIMAQMEGLFPMPFWFNMGIPQSWQWTLMAPYFVSCPAENPKIEWQNFPALNITNNPQGWQGNPAISNNRTALSAPGREVFFSWEQPGKQVGPTNTPYQYITNTTAGAPKFALWVSQLNATYTPLMNVTNGTAYTLQPNGTVFEGYNDPIVNGTVFVALTDTDLYVTPYNLSFVNPHVVAGPAIYQSG